MNACRALRQRNHNPTYKVSLVGDLCPEHCTGSIAVLDAGEIYLSPCTDRSDVVQPTDDLLRESSPFQTSMAMPYAEDFANMLDDQNPIAHLAGHAHTLNLSEASQMSDYARSAHSPINSNCTQVSTSEVSSYSGDLIYVSLRNQFRVLAPNVRTPGDDIVRSMPVDIMRSSLSSYGTASNTNSASTSSCYGYTSLASSSKVDVSFLKNEVQIQGTHRYFTKNSKAIWFHQIPYHVLNLPAQISSAILLDMKFGVLVQVLFGIRFTEKSNQPRHYRVAS